MATNSTAITDLSGIVISSSKEEVKGVNLKNNSKIFDCLESKLSKEELNEFRAGFDLVASGERRQFAVKQYLGHGTYFRVRAQAMNDNKTVTISVRVGGDDIIEQLAHHFRTPLFSITEGALGIAQKSLYLEDIMENAITYIEIKEGKYPITRDENFDLYTKIVMPVLRRVMLADKDLELDFRHKYSIKEGDVTNLSTSRKGLIFVYKQGIANAIDLGYNGGHLTWGFRDSDISGFFKLNIYSHAKRFIPLEEAEGMFKDTGLYLEDNVDIENPELVKEALKLRLWNSRKIIELQGGKMWVETGYDPTNENTPYFNLCFTARKAERA